MRSARAAVAALPAAGRVFVAPGCGAPTVLCDALGAEQDRFDGLTLYCGLLFEPPGFLAAVPERLRLVSLHPTGAVEPLITAGRADYLPLRYSRIPDAFVLGGALAVDAALIQVSPPDARGYCSLGAAVGTTAQVARSAPLVIAEINPRSPRTHGEGVLHVSEIDIGVETDHPLVELRPARVGETERAIARHVAGLVPDGGTIQIGIGGVPQAILEALDGHRDLGVHSGLLCDGMIPLVDAGVITGARKSLDPYKLGAGELIGTATLFDWAHDNAAIRMLPARLSHGLEYVQGQERFIAINSALEVDLTGQVNAEWLAGRQVSGLGGSFDFLEGALYSRGGAAIVALPATAAGGSLSRIVPRLAAGTAVTGPRYCVDYVVTEFGIADLRARTLRERAEALVAVAHPAFRDELVAAVGSMAQQ
ncbi:MAG: acetyl-CoA hydrolase/transferase C-terminal domain-containing protein [Dehalococcoidia bacterium]